MSGITSGLSSPGIVSPLDQSTTSTIGPHSASSDKESVEPERGLFTITDDDRPPPAHSYYSPLAASNLTHDHGNAQWPLDNKSVPAPPEVVPVEKEMLHGQRGQIQSEQQPRQWQQMHEDMSDKQALNPSNPRKQSQKRWSRRSVLIAAALILVVVIGLAVGLGVGLGMKKDNSQSQSGQSSGSNSTDSSIIRNDSSIAAVESGIGDRFVFWQDGQNDIRWAGYSNSTSKWSSTNTLATSIKPKPGSPIVAYVMPGEDLNTQSLIELLYIANNNSLVEIEIAPDKSIQTNIPIDSRALVAASDAMRMSIASSLRPGSNDTVDSFLMFRTPDTIGIWQRTDSRSNWSFENVWYDITNDFTDTINSSACEPFTVDTFFSGTSSGNQPATLARFIMSNCDATSPQIISSLFNLKDQSFTSSTSQVYSFTNSTQTSSVQGDPAIGQADWVGVEGTSEWYFIADDELKAFSTKSSSLNQSIPSSSFPYSRLSTLHYDFGTRGNILYNQLDSQTFAEHSYNAESKSWSTNSIDITELSSN